MSTSPAWRSVEEVYGYGAALAEYETFDAELDISLNPSGFDLLYEIVEDLRAGFGEFRRVLRPDGHAVIYQMMATAWLQPGRSRTALASGGNLRLERLTRATSMRRSVRRA